MSPIHTDTRAPKGDTRATAPQATGRGWSARPGGPFLVRLELVTGAPIHARTTGPNIGRDDE